MPPKDKTPADATPDAPPAPETAVGVAGDGQEQPPAPTPDPTPDPTPADPSGPSDTDPTGDDDAADDAEQGLDGVCPVCFPDGPPEGALSVGCEHSA
jgi:hypothetical protein